MILIKQYAKDKWEQFWKEKLGINVFGFSCEGYKGVSQSAGHHIANNQLFKHIIGLDDQVRPGKFKLKVLESRVVEEKVASDHRPVLSVIELSL